MKTLTRSLAIVAALGVAGTLGASLLFADSPKPPPPASPPPADPAKPGATPPAAGEKLAPVKVTDAKVEMKTAVNPKPLSPAIKNGLAYLVKGQQEDGGWNQGGGWRTQLNDKGGGGRVEGKNVEDPSDVGNTCIVLLALIRAGSTPTDGEYKDAVMKGLRYVLGRIEKADSESLYVTDVRNTQLQSKIGPYVDTFLANLVLAELRGKAGPEEKRLIVALEKTMNKIVRHQTADGGFANNGGWAPTLSVGIANKSLARAKQNGVEVDGKVLERALAQSKGAAAGTGTGGRAGAVPGGPLAKGGKDAARPLPGAGAGFAGGIGGGGMPAGDAGVRLYSGGQGAGNSQDVINSLRVDGEKAKRVLADAKASKEDKDQAQKTVDNLKKAEADNDKIQENLAKETRSEGFVAGFGSNGGEEFLSFLNISEALLIKGGKDWEEWDAKMTKGLEKAQDKEGSWAGHHCITGKTFCTASALLVLMADRTPFPADVLKAAAEKKDQPKPNEKK